MFTKKNLKNGMVVETRDGNRYMVVDGKLIGNNGWLSLGDYDDQLYDLDDRLSSYDIMMVFDVVSSLELDKIDRPLLFDRRSAKARSKTNENRAKYFCKEFANIYGLDESKLYSRFLRILYEVSGRKVCITEFDIEKCSETDINESVRELGKECSTYYIIKITEKD